MRLRITSMALASLITLAGCQERHSPGEADHDDDHAGHVIPAHKPKDFPSAVAKLRVLNGQIASKYAEGKARSLVEDKTLPIALDIANWLPEIAADSDMPEAPWNQVDERSTTLIDAYQKLLDGAADTSVHADPAPVIKQADSAISGLEMILGSANPTWFTSSKSGAN
jgi:hypothetical protein